MSQELEHVLAKRAASFSLKMFGVYSDTFWTGTLAGVDRDIRIQYNGNGVFVPRSIIGGLLGTNYSLTAAVCKMSIEDMKGKELLPMSHIANTRIGQSYDNFDYAPAMLNGDYFTCTIRNGVAGGSRTGHIVLVGMEFLMP